MNYKIINLLLIFISFHCFSQETIQINVVDSLTNEPLPFTTLYLKNMGKGTTTNFDGKALFKLPKQDLKTDTLVCSYIGYNKKIIPIDFRESAVISIQLTASTTKLKEVEIVYKKPLTAKKILKKVLKNTTKNYSQSNVNFQALYRELMQEKGKYIYLNEAVVDIHYTKYIQNNIDRKTYKKWEYDDSYGFEFSYSWFDGFPMQFNTREDKMKIIECRSSESSSRNNVDIPITGSPLSLTAKDYIKYRYDFLNPKTFNNYIYTKKENESIDDKNCYVIQFHPKTSSKKVIFNHIFKNKNGIYTGRLYIDKSSFAIVKMEYQLIQNFDYGFYTHRVPLEHKVSVEYKEFESKWYLHKISLLQTRKIYIPKTKTAHLINAYQELFITNVHTNSVHQIADTEEWKDTRLTQLRNYETTYNPEFWKNYTANNYPKLSDKIKKDLESKIPLSKQFKNRFKQQENLPIPIAKKEKTIHTYPYETREDYYHWFSDPTKRKEFFDYLEKENEYAENYLIPHKKTQKRLFQDLNHFYAIDTVQKNVKHKKGDIRTAMDSLQNYHIYEYQDSLSRKSIFNYDAFKTKRQDCYISSSIKISKKNLAIRYTTNAGKNNTLIIQPKGNQTAIDSVSEIYSFEWFNDSLLLYTKNNKMKRSDKLYCRNIYTQTDSLLLFEKDLTFDISISKTKNTFICSIQSMNENEIYLSEKELKYPKFNPILLRKPNINHTIKEFGNERYILTNQNSPNNKIAHLKNGILNDIIRVKEDVHIFDFSITDDYYIIQTKKKSYAEILYKKKSLHQEIDKKKWDKIDFPSDIFSVDFWHTDKNKIHFSYSSPKTPSSHYTYNLESKKLTNIKTTKIKPTYRYNLNSLRIERIWAKAEDGTKIPITVIKNVNPSKKHKGLILKAYGMYGAYGRGYGFNMEDITLLANGYTIAYAHVRGGSEMGEKWHLDGKLLQKENTFKDYISCAEYLIQKKYTTPDFLIGYGQSAGGLLMGVVINRRPELFNTVILDHPYLDALTTMMMDTLPLTVDHYKEIGNPKEKEYYTYMKAYSPYQNIKKQVYPNLLFIAGANDYQTPTWQIAKYVAKVRENNTGSNTILFKTDFRSGHIGSTYGNQWIKDLSFKNTFIHLNLFE